MKTIELKKSGLLVMVFVSLSVSEVFAVDTEQTQLQDQMREQIQQQTQQQTQDPNNSQIRNQETVRDRERIYGSELMTPAERAEYRSKMRSLKTYQERENYRNEHHQRMQERARTKGLELPDSPEGQGSSRGHGGGRRGR